MSQELGSLLGRWHQWRGRYSHERGFARARVEPFAMHDDDDELEAMLMRSIEDAICGMSPQLQLALQHVARAECLGVEVIMSNRLPTDKVQRESLCDLALHTLAARLVAQGLL
jgi:hypothetical protein